MIFAADSRFEDKLAERDLIPMAGRIRTRLSLDRATPEELMAHLKHLVTSAGNAKLMTPELMKTICDHSLGNLRAMTSLCAELLAVGIQKELGQGEIELGMQLSSFAEVVPWILSWGEHARVIAPKALAREVKDAAGRVVRSYGR